MYKIRRRENPRICVSSPQDNCGTLPCAYSNLSFSFRRKADSFPLLGRGRSCACISKLQMRGEGSSRREKPLTNLTPQRLNVLTSLLNCKTCCHCERSEAIQPCCHCARGKCNDAQSQGFVEPEFWIASSNSVLLAMTRKAVGCIAMHQNTAGGKLCCQ